METQDNAASKPADSATRLTEPDETGATSDRREFLKKTARRVAYVAPIVLFFKPREAVAGSGGSAITPGP